MPLGVSIRAFPAVRVANIVVGLGRPAAVLAIADRGTAVGRWHANPRHEGTGFLGSWACYRLKSKGQNEKDLERDHGGVKSK